MQTAVRLSQIDWMPWNCYEQSGHIAANKKNSPPRTSCGSCLIVCSRASGNLSTAKSIKENGWIRRASKCARWTLTISHMPWILLSLLVIPVNMGSRSARPSRTLENSAFIWPRWASTDSNSSNFSSVDATGWSLKNNVEYSISELPAMRPCRFCRSSARAPLI